MIIGFHLIWTTYGHWFPNDPRGSWSDEVWKPQLRAIANLERDHKTLSPFEVDAQELQMFLDGARGKLKHGAVTLTETEQQAVGRAFEETARRALVCFHACAIMSNHVHVIIERPEQSYERITNRLKGRSSQLVRQLRCLPKATTAVTRVPIWTDGYWVRYVDSVAQMDQVIAYVEENPVKEGLPRQDWSFITRAG